MSSLAVLKQTLSRPEALILIMNDFAAKQVLVAWTLYGSVFTETPARKGEEVRTTVSRWWSELHPNLDTVAAIAGQPVTRVKKTFDRLKAAYLVWPDGTIAPDAMSIIRGERNAYVRSLMPRTPATDKPKDDKGNSDDGKRKGAEDKKGDRKSRSIKARR